MSPTFPPQNQVVIIADLAGTTRYVKRQRPNIQCHTFVGACDVEHVITYYEQHGFAVTESFIAMDTDTAGYKPYVRRTTLRKADS